MVLRNLPCISIVRCPGRPVYRFPSSVADQRDCTIWLFSGVSKEEPWTNASQTVLRGRGAEVCCDNFVRSDLKADLRFEISDRKNLAKLGGTTFLPARKALEV